ncbi:STAS domain-containing protein [Streptomyces sp. NPDC056480]|uniref:STAS domain-containing protein n=1 Tax=Streptomyces sp. NPDC056480 TaxID=3345833 RepID=UPI0036CFE3B6
MPLSSEAILLESPWHTRQDSRVSVSVQDAPGGPVVSITGELDLTSATHLRALLMKTVEACPRGWGITLDLSRVTFCDCTGLHVLLCTRRLALSNRRPLVINAASPRMDRLLEITGTAPLFTSAR